MIAASSSSCSIAPGASARRRRRRRTPARRWRSATIRNAPEPQAGSRMRMPRSRVPIGAGRRRAMGSPTSGQPASAFHRANSGSIVSSMIRRTAHSGV